MGDVVAPKNCDKVESLQLITSSRSSTALASRAVSTVTYSGHGISCAIEAALRKLRSKGELCATTTSVLSIGTEEITSGLLDPEEFGISRAPISALVGGDGAENARITRAIFNGEKGAHRDACILNAAAAIAAFEGKSQENLQERISNGVKAAHAAIDSGAAKELVIKWAELTQRLGA